MTLISMAIPSKYVGVNDLAGAVDLKHDTLGTSDCARSEPTCVRQPQPELLRRFLVLISQAASFWKRWEVWFFRPLRCASASAWDHTEDCAEGSRNASGASASQGLSTGLAEPSSERPDGESKRKRPPKLEAGTEFETLCTFDDGADGASLVVATAGTTVANQMQRHLLHMGFPVCCDKHYGIFRVNRRFAGVFGLDRVFLHCFEVEVSSTWTQSKLLTFPLPNELLPLSEGLPEGAAAWIGSSVADMPAGYS